MFVTVAYPYPSGAMHIGHGRTYTVPDVYARFKRMQGFNVLFAQGFHATGEPILGTIERLKNKDETQIETFKLYGASDADINNFIKKGPEFTARFWMKKWIEILKSAGYSIDWRRTFVTAITPTYNRFVEWQYNTLRKKDYVIQGTHPVIWCPKDQSPTGDHDRLEGEGESPIEYIIVKFKLDSGEIIPCATLRPETVYGVTNIWVNPEGKYFGYPQKRIVPIGKGKGANLSIFTDDEISFVDEVIESFRKYNASQLSEWTHKLFPWQYRLSLVG
jgi:leucyl-tRNA synthetase